MHNPSSELCIQELACPAAFDYALRMSETILAKNIAALRKHLALSQEQFAAMVGSAQANVSKWEAKGIVPGPAPLAKMAELAGSTIGQFMEEPWRPRASLSRSDAAPTHRVDEGETVEISQLDLSFSMGPGTNVDDYVEETPVKMDLAFLRSITRTAPDRLRLGTGAGDSMFPTLHNNDMILFDTTMRMLNQQDRIWVISLYGAGGIKRLRAIGPSRVMVISDNPSVDNQEVDAEDIAILGRVIWFAREL